MPHRLTIPTVLVLFLVLPCRGADAPELSSRVLRLAGHRFTAADFVQTRNLEELGMKIEIRGKMLSERDGRLRWQVDSPLRSVTVIEREKLTHFDCETGKPAVLHRRDIPWLGTLRECMNDWLSGDPERLARRFSVSSPDKDSLLLIPNDRTLKNLYRSIRLTLSADREKLERIVIEERDGDRLEIRFTNVIHPPELPESVWRMPPE